MLDGLFASVLTGSAATGVTGIGFLACCAASLALGACIAGIYMFRHRYSKNFVVTLALLPVVVQMVISLVNGNIGAGIAVMGVFNLVRFRSIPGSAKDIGAVFIAMAIGLATGMGYLALAFAFTLIIAVANAIFVLSPLGNAPHADAERMLRITIPEELNYCTEFDDLFKRYTVSHELLQAKTTNLGSLFSLEYRISLFDPQQEKEFIDAIRVRNGNLSVVCGKPLVDRETL